jgi:hypothetical protein
MSLIDEQLAEAVSPRGRRVCALIGDRREVIRPAADGGTFQPSEMRGREFGSMVVPDLLATRRASGRAARLERTARGRSNRSSWKR